ncbi:uncharacterized protein LOC130369960 isoform X1 [Gadus chalcogrammus]|uniref:uncharacterized protein LOC130369960 isoform X1 n=1 Tax=Gadus chalcogrammus TaxID=1042646 RepID=UPI0024C48A2B|nr:uncharacterized protein LOC130369960 isoform X1 [Gadus chalcogrammus]
MGKIYQVIVIGLNGEHMTIDLCDTEEQMKAMTVLQLKEKIGERLPGNGMDNIRLIFATNVLVDDEMTLGSYGVQHKSVIHMVIRKTDASIRRSRWLRATSQFAGSGVESETRRNRQFCDPPSSRYSFMRQRVRGHGKEPNKMSVEKAYDPSDPSFKFVDRPDVIDPYQDESCRAEMSCGHAVTPGSLTGWCRSLLSKGQSKFTCPAVQPDGEMCGAEWSYQEVRRFALLTVEEMDHFEKELARIVVAKFKACPGCKTYVERQALDNLCFRCTICEESSKPTHYFCWQCLRPWKGRGPRSDRCDNDDCSDKVLDLLKSCDPMTLEDVPGVGPCPSIRACPNCGMKVEHNQKACKNIVCPRCKVEFCFVCLKLKTKCCETSNSYTACSSGVAPRQTAIPTWNS